MKHKGNKKKRSKSSQRGRGRTGSQADDGSQALPPPHDDGGEDLASQEAVLDTGGQGVEALVTQHGDLVVQCAAADWKLRKRQNNHIQGPGPRGFVPPRYVGWSPNYQISVRMSYVSIIADCKRVLNTTSAKPNLSHSTPLVQHTVIIG